MNAVSAFNTAAEFFFKFNINFKFNCKYDAGSSQEESIDTSKRPYIA